VAGEKRHQYARINVVAAAGRKADIKIDGLAAIEIGYGIRHGVCWRDEGDGNHDAQEC
jgi:hypothetical protein